MGVFSVKYVSITFDDGRIDNYLEAYPVMKENDIEGTIFCTTGYIDGSWQKPSSWRSAGNPLTIDQLSELKGAGWEIALHGDKHTTEANDFQESLRKLKSWGLADSPIGFSMPNSKTPEKELNNLINLYLNKDIKYIRTGRKIDTSKISSKILFAGYTYLGTQFAYNQFNKKNVLQINTIDVKSIFSVVIRYKDNPQMILDFLDWMPENSLVVFMLHSILPKKNPLYGTDPWNWSTNRFEQFCSGLSSMKNAYSLDLKPLSQFI